MQRHVLCTLQKDDVQIDIFLGKGHFCLCSALIFLNKGQCARTSSDIYLSLCSAWILRRPRPPLTLTTQSRDLSFFSRLASFRPVGHSCGSDLFRLIAGRCAAERGWSRSGEANGRKELSQKQRKKWKSTKKMRCRYHLENRNLRNQKGKLICKKFGWTLDIDSALILRQEFHRSSWIVSSLTPKSLSPDLWFSWDFFTSAVVGNVPSTAGLSLNGFMKVILLAPVLISGKLRAKILIRFQVSPTS